MIFKSYPKYIPCSIQWFTEIPQGWKEVRVEQYLVKKDENIGSLWSSTQLLSLTQKGVIEKDINDGKGKTHSDYSTYQAIDKGDLVFCLFDIDETPRTVGLSTKKGMITSAYTAFKSKENINTQYVYYFFESLDDAKALKPYYKGLRKTVRPPEFLKIHVPFPPKEEQDVISKFLDSETSRIDNLIAKQEKLIELLEEQRKSIISHAVTKGLNPNAPMKDSGVEWLGEVPEHWKIGRLKNLLSINNGSDYKEFEVENSENSYPVYGSGGVFTYSSKYIYDQESVLLGRKGTINKPLYVTSPFWAVDTMFYSQVKQGVHGKYVYYQALGFPYDRYSSNTALPSMTQTDLLNLSVAIPIISEQIEITQFLDNENTMFDNLISKQKKLIEKLKEYRASIISHAVTGKIDVREFGA